MKSILQQALFLCDSHRKLSDSDIKSMFLTIAAKVDKIQKKVVQQGQFQSVQTRLPEDKLVANDIYEKINSKLIELEQRRKNWQQIMSIVMNQKQKIGEDFNKKIKELQKFSTQIKSEVRKVRDLANQKLGNFEEDRVGFRLILSERFERAKNEYTEMWNKKFEALSERLQNEVLNKQHKFYISCQQFCSQDYERQDLSPDNRGKDTSDFKQKETVTTKCRKVQLVIKNFGAFSKISQDIQQFNMVLDRFQKKLLLTGGRIETIEDKLGSFMDNLMKKNVHSQNTEKTSFNIYQSKQKHQVGIFSQSFRSFFSFYGRKITFVNPGNSQQAVSLLLKPQIREKNKFSVRIIKSQKNYISIGITDISYSNQRDVWGSTNFIMLRANKGEIYIGPSKKIKQTSASFQTGDLVTIQVNIKESRVHYYINNVHRATYFDQRIEKSYMRWVPMVRFFTLSDCVQWI